MATPTTQHVRIGRRNGVEWICYREPGDTDAEFAARIQQMREAYLAQRRGRR